MDKVDYGKKPLQMEDYGMDKRHYQLKGYETETEKDCEEE